MALCSGVRVPVDTGVEDVVGLAVLSGLER